MGEWRPGSQEKKVYQEGRRGQLCQMLPIGQEKGGLSYWVWQHGGSCSCC